MHIFETLTQQYGGPAKGTLFGMMNGHSAHETSTYAEEQVGISVREATKGIKSVAVHSDRNTRGEGRILIKEVPVGVVERRHDGTLSHTN
jgi:hypothetical protein